MRFVADESLDFAIVRSLRSQGFEVFSVVEMAGGSLDPDVLAIAKAQNAVLLTEDKDFGDLVFKNKLAHRGVVLIRLSGLSRAEKESISIEAILKNLRFLESRFSVISKTKFRTRTI